LFPIGHPAGFEVVGLQYAVQWLRRVVENGRREPADNNSAERQLRPTVIARKTSFGSQSDAGAATREVLMTLVHTLALRFPDPQTHFRSALDQLAEDPARANLRLLFPQDSS
jgi:hypothetical protein